MAVLLTNALLGVRRRQDAGRDAHGARVPGDWDAVGEMLPGRVKEAADGAWSLGVDISLWPIRQGDLIADDAGNEWHVDTADPIRNNLDPTVDWVRIAAHERKDGHTEPGGARFVGR